MQIRLKTKEQKIESSRCLISAEKECASKQIHLSCQREKLEMEGENKESHKNIMICSEFY